LPNTLLVYTRATKMRKNRHISIRTSSRN